jgi:mercuric ion transport protein
MTGKQQAGSAAAMAAGGVGTAFTAAACCGLPVVLTGLGVGTSWLLPIAAAVGPFADMLLVVAGLLLLVSLLLVWRRPTVCVPGALCARPLFRLGISAGSMFGLALLVVARP